LSAIRETLLQLISKMQQPSLPELLEFADEMSHIHKEYRDIASKSYGLIYYYLNSLVLEREILCLTANSGYSKRYCMYHDDRQLDMFVEPIPSITSQARNFIKLRIYSDELLLKNPIKLLKKKICGGRELRIFRLRNRLFVILDHVLLGVLSNDGSKWHIRLPWRVFQIGTEYRIVFTKLRSIGEKAQVLGVKGRRTVCG